MKVVLKTIQLCFFIGVLIVLVFYVVLLCVFTFLIPQCEAPFEFHINTMFGSSLSLVVCRRNHVLFTLFVFFYVYCCVFFFLCLRLVHPNVASFSGLSTFFFIPSVFRYRRLYQSSKAQNVDFSFFFSLSFIFMSTYILKLN